MRDTTLNRGVGEWVPLAAYEMDAAILDVFLPGALRWFGKTQGPVVKVLSVSGQRSMRQLALRVHAV
ncbi:hypothetical protein TNCV_3955971 [Trichonephila clavipes]|nr:hypothetical protein TNCV_3955971 [Trichonephila clavipes]